LTWATSVPILVFIGLFVLDVGLMYATDRRQTSDVTQTDVRRVSSLNASALIWGRRHNKPTTDNVIVIGIGFPSVVEENYMQLLLSVTDELN